MNTPDRCVSLLQDVAPEFESVARNAKKTNLELSLRLASCFTILSTAAKNLSPYFSGDDDGRGALDKSCSRAMKKILATMNELTTYDKAESPFAFAGLQIIKREPSRSNEVLADLIEKASKGNKDTQIQKQVAELEILAQEFDRAGGGLSQDIREVAKSLYGVLSKRQLWECVCEPEHEKQSLLSAPQDLVYAEERNSAVPFYMLFRTPEQVDMRWRRSKISVSCLRKHVVRFNDSTTKANSSSIPVSDASISSQRVEVKLICDSIKKRGAGNSAMFLENGTLWEATDSADERNEATEMETGKVISLRKILEKDYPQLEDKFKLQLGIRAAHLLLALHDSQWLPPQLGRNDICLLEQNHTLFPIPYVRRDFAATRSATDDSASDEVVDLKTALAVLLVETWTQQAFKQKITGKEKGSNNSDQGVSDTLYISLVDRIEEIKQYANDHEEDGEDGYEAKVRPITEAIESCLQVGNETPSGLYDRVVRPLEIGISREWRIPLENGTYKPCASLREPLCDEFAQNISNGSSKEWFRRLQVVHKFLKEEGIRACTQVVEKKNEYVRIAVLDTGVNMNDPTIQTNSERIWGCQSFLGSGEAHDTDGHGTCVVRLLLKATQNAAIYVGKVAETSKTVDPSAVAAAIQHSTSTWNVDLINMSFGFHNDTPETDKIEDAIAAAAKKNILMFAASHNEGNNMKVAFPAKRTGVICIGATSAMGKDSEFTPTVTPFNSGGQSFVTLGQNIKVPGKEISGTSFATPIAVGIAALIMDYVLHHLSKPEFYPLRVHTNDPSAQRERARRERLARKIKTLDGMTRILNLLCFPKTNYLAPWILICAENREYVPGLLLGGLL